MQFLQTVHKQPVPLYSANQLHHLNDLFTNEWIFFFWQEGTGNWIQALKQDKHETYGEHINLAWINNLWYECAQSLCESRVFNLWKNKPQLEDVLALFIYFFFLLWQNTLEKTTLGRNGLFWLTRYGWTQFVRAGKPGDRKGELSVTLHLHSGSRAWTGRGLNISSQWPTFSSKASPLKGPMTLPNNATSLGSSVQTHKPMGDTPYWTHSRGLLRSSTIFIKVAMEIIVN